MVGRRRLAQGGWVTRDQRHVDQHSPLPNILPVDAGEDPRLTARHDLSCLFESTASAVANER